MRFAFVRAEKARHAVPILCRMLRVSRSGFYAWCKREPSVRAMRDAQLGVDVVSIHHASRGTYGRPRVLAELRARGERTSGKRVARLMRERGISGHVRKRWRHPTGAPADAAANVHRYRSNPLPILQQTPNLGTLRS